MEVAACAVSLQPSSRHLASSSSSSSSLKSGSPNLRNASQLMGLVRKAAGPRSIGRSSDQRRINALFGGGDKDKVKDKKKFITKEEEPAQYWQSAAEKEGKGPMSTVLPYIVIFGFMTPFIILGLGFANGWIKVPVR